MLGEETREGLPEGGGSAGVRLFAPGVEACFRASLQETVARALFPSQGERGGGEALGFSLVYSEEAEWRRSR